MRRLSGQDWVQHVALSVQENDRTGDYDPELHERFAQTRAQARRALSEQELGASFGAFADGSSSPTWASSGAAPQRGIRASAQTTSTVAAGWPPTFSAWPPGGPLIVAATSGSS